MQLQAGYTLEIIYKQLQAFVPSKAKGLCYALSYFEVESNFNNNSINLEEYPLFAVASNIISRGLTTKMSVELESIFADTFKKTIEEIKYGSISFATQNLEKALLAKVYEKMHLIEPRLRLTRNNYRPIEKLDSEFEKSFLFDYTGGHNFLVQLFEPQRGLSSLLSTDYKDKYVDSRADFVCEYPYEVEGSNGQIVEIDGSGHTAAVDTKRDIATKDASWETERITNREKGVGFVNSFVTEEPIKFYHKNYQQNEFTEPDLEVFQLALSPFAIARVQKTIIECVLRGQLDLNQNEWNISVIERDVPCGHLAIEDFQRLMNHLFLLEGKGRKLPQINIQIFSTPEFMNTKLNQNCSIKPISQFSKESCDLVLDVAMLERKGLIDRKDYQRPKNHAIIRSAYNKIGQRKFYTTNLIKYKEVAKKLENGDYKVDVEGKVALTYFLKNIFRKASFRTGQIEILSRALQGKSVIGLLPTGGGKSLTYQLAVMLQAGTALVIDPIRSLMKDQVDNLLKAQIDACTFINSSIKSRKEKVANTHKMQYGQVLFTFVSPERLQMEEFRSVLNDMYEKQKVYFSFCIIDEVHCVSEWGHDFRTSYLRLGENAMKFCRIKNEEEVIPLFGLTATASFDVLADVQRELKLLDDNAAIVSSENNSRPELQFKIIKVEDVALTEIRTNPNDDSETEWAIRNAAGIKRQNKLIQLLRDIPRDIQLTNDRLPQAEEEEKRETYINELDTTNFYGGAGELTNSGLIFCPHRGSYFGVYITRAGKKENSVYAKIRDDYEQLRVGRFLGGDEDNDANQDAYVANNTDVLVATKAFGMGIDKPNIRFTIHFNIPSSIESFYQEAGRAGRDRKLAKCYVLWSEQKPLLKETTKNEKIYNSTVDKELLMYFHRNSFKGVQKEIWVIYELLNEITFPSGFSPQDNNDLITIIFEEHKVDISLSYWEFKDLKRLYVNYLANETNSVGFININNLNYGFAAKKPPVNVSKAHEILATLTKEIRKKAGKSELTPANWLNKFIHAKLPNRPGIEKILDNIEIGDKRELLVGFENNGIDKINKIVQYLVNEHRLHANITTTDSQGKTKKYADLSADKKTDFVKKACIGSVDIEDFLKKLTDEYKRYLRGKTIELSIVGIPPSRIENLLRQIRSEEDTYKAIYRLSVIGVLDDYTVDYNKQLFTLRFTKQKKDYYLQHLYEYVRKFDLEENAKRMLKEVPEITNSKGDKLSEIQQCQRYLIDFTYQKIAKKREQAINVMNDGAALGVEKDGAAFGEYMEIYFQSKYANLHNTPNLVEDTKEGIKSDIGIVWKYMRLMGQQSEGGAVMYNLKHLRGACDRMLNDYNTKNPIFKLLKSFALLLLETKEVNGELKVLSPRFISEAQTNYIDGFATYNYAQTELLEKIAEFQQIIYTYNKGLKGLLDALTDVILIRQHNLWLQNFNQQFLKDYDSPNTGITTNRAATAAAGAH